MVALPMSKPRRQISRLAKIPTAATPTFSRRHDCGPSMDDLFGFGTTTPEVEVLFHAYLYVDFWIGDSYVMASVKMTV
jgi:hypothetical protein